MLLEAHQAIALMDPEHCTLDTCPIQNAYIHYQPTIAGNSVYLALFGIFLFTQLIQSIFFRMWGFAGAMAAGLVLEIIIIYHGEEISRLKPRNYAIFFVSCDVIALILQSAGGALTSAAEDADGRQMGLNVMIAGLVFQVAALTLFIALASVCNLSTTSTSQGRISGFSQCILKEGRLCGYTEKENVDALPLPYATCPLPDERS
ncbi:hypothetical protein KXX33_000370 [Aspergillus fumigatus]|uniref:Uncharacterized protein n=1 Tax=Aspergillus fumigatus TaxID=746128 RepID=A0A229WR21_ASPFM|nr:hypothetical protein CNMCM8057_003421 [Aspergillus fumigatus]KAF4273881.1 hypothetical protein CNMCM8812_006790 [Aspergillus fumigatus]KAH1274333.1 hypothetical protein KXX30_005072 [Aspergillus fumigatus]KAH1275142.1 hypothetical protein KXX45_006519 [Aspergillus fumigatus]KAH1309536.1 hypothetical protein KXX66_000525 [Aspergillus fumigatus]